jgi:hypothetical protein
MCQRKIRHEKSRRIIYEFSFKMGVLNEKRCKNKNKGQLLTDCIFLEQAVIYSSYLIISCGS